MWAERLKNNLGKSNHGGQSLYDHIADCVRAGARVAQLAGESPGARLDTLLFALAVHDIGKLDPNFQAMLEASSKGLPLPSKKVKHEASTFDYDHVSLVNQCVGEICEVVKFETGYRPDTTCLTEQIEWVWALTVSHHGLFYFSLEARNDSLEPVMRVRREWTTFNYGEVKRITLADCLWRFHPLGGLVIVGDLIGSYCFEQGISQDDVFRNVKSYRELLSKLFDRNAPEVVEQSIQKYDPRDFGLRGTLKLLAGGIR